MGSATALYVTSEQPLMHAVLHVRTVMYPSPQASLFSYIFYFFIYCLKQKTIYSTDWQPVTMCPDLPRQEIMF